MDKTWQYWCEQKWQKMDTIKITIIVFYATMYVIYPIKFQISIQNKFETLICNTNEPILHTLMMTINPLKRMFSYLNLSFYYSCLIFSFDGCRITFLFPYKLIIFWTLNKKMAFSFHMWTNVHNICYSGIIGWSSLLWKLTWNAILFLLNYFFHIWKGSFTRIKLLVYALKSTWQFLLFRFSINFYLEIFWFTYFFHL